ncbi:MAG: IS30 family transposase [Rhodoferax sp.]|nr:IS30 family transposase [Rhodoferax sp.]
MSYKHLSQIERYQIHSLMNAGHNSTQIADLLGRSKSTISRELRRNAGSRGYRPKQACELSRERAQGSRNAAVVAPWVKQQANALLNLQWSPEQIAGKLPVSHETLYQHVYADKAQGGKLWKNLRCQKQKRKRYASGRDRRGQIPNRRPLSERPAHIEERKQIGHWECDTVIGANHKQAIVTVVERKSGYAVIAKVSNKTADLVGDAIIQALKPLQARVKTLTYDNGKEFCGHAKIDDALGSTSYFARPFASWERGSNENFNGLLRQYVPKKRKMENITDEEIRMIENRLNNRPRKRLGFKTPSEVFHQSLSRVALRA